MAKEKDRHLNKIKTIIWAFSLAWRFDKKLLCLWIVLISTVSILPAVALYYNRIIIEGLNSFSTANNGNISDILPAIILFGSITALIGLSNRLSTEFIYSIVSNSYYYGMEDHLMDSVQEFSMEELMQKQIDREFLSATIRQGTLTEFISGSLTIIGKLTGCISLLIVAFSLSIPVFLISVFYIIIILIVNLIFTDKLRGYWEKRREFEQLARHYENMALSPEYSKEMRVFGSESLLMKNWKEAYSEIYSNEIKNNFTIEFRAFASGLGFYLLLAAMMLYNLFTINTNNISGTDILIIFILSLSIFKIISGIAEAFLWADSGLFILEWQKKFFGLREKHATNEKVEKKLDFKNNIVFEANELSFTYSNGRHAIQNLSFSIKRGEIIALVGENGSGKSTLINLLLKLYKPTSGKLYFCGEDYESINEKNLRDKIGVFFQDYYMFHLPIVENTGFGDIENMGSGEKINNALKKGGALDFVESLPKGVNTYIYKLVEETGMNFSGGEMQKLAASRAHMSNKDILIFDEPASMLDPISELEQFMFIKDKIEGNTTILVSHRIGFARLADKIILMSNGSIAEQGTHDELMEINGLYAAFFNEQSMWYQNSLEASEDE